MSIRRVLPLACLLAMLLAVLPARAEISFTDDLGVRVTLPESPRRTAVLFSSFAEIWRCAGGDIAITVGESVERGFADGDCVLVDAGAGKTINTEILLAARPDFVICSADIPAQVQAAQLLNRAGIPAACFRVENFGQYLQVLQTCTAITGNPEAMQTYGTDVQARVQAQLARIEGGPAKKRILFIRAGSGASSTKAKRAEDHFAAAMLEELGAENIADAAPVLLDGLSIEAVLLADPDFIFIATMGDESAAAAHMEAVFAQPAWQALTAVREGNYAYLPKELFQYKPNARWDLAYACLIDYLIA